MADVFDYFKKVQDEVMKNLNNVFSTDYKKPMSDITQNPKEVVVHLKLPDVQKKDIILEIHKDRIEVKAEVKKQKIKKTRDVYDSEESYRGFLRNISLPRSLDTEKAVAVFKNNVLTVTIPKLKVKKIRIA